MASKIISLVCSVILLQIYLIQCSPVTTTTPVTTTINISDDLEEVENHTLAPGSPEIEVEALKFLKEVNHKSYKAYNDLAVASWNYETNITDETENARAKAEADNYKFEADIQTEMENRFPHWDTFSDSVIKKQFSNFAIQGPGNMSIENIQKMAEIESKMETAYATTTICDFHDKTKCDLRLDRDINKKLANSKNWDERTYYWTAWHDAMSKAVPATLYQTFVKYQNQMAQANDFENMGEMWITQYNDYSDDWTTDSFKEEIRQLEEDIRPIYNVLHAYVRMKLKQNPEYAGKIPKSGHLPVQILGNMWGQDWTALDTTKPYASPEVTSTYATKALKKANYSVERLFREADQFFSDLGLLRVPESFWKLSRLERPKDNREVVCHPSAWDFSNGTDVRITMCAEVTLDDLLTAHHEMGHIQYYLQYHNLPHVFQDGANPGFHEAIGDSLALSIMTPVHLQCRLHLDLGLEDICNKSTKLDDQPTNSNISETEMNFLYLAALQKIPFLPFAYALEAWRWKAFNLSITAEDYNKEWWRMRTSLQGVIPPTDRNSPSFFDPASKFHIVSNEPYISYFISYILQFQFYEAMCKAANQYDESSDAKNPLHRCDISGSKAAGKLLGNMMKLGCSTDWRSALEIMTGTRHMSAKPLLNYFKPLTAYMKQELEKNHEAACYGDYC